MPKEVDYPRGSLRKSLELAQAVADLGGNCKIESSASKLGKKDSGAFRALVSAADKYGVIRNKRGQLSTTDLFREYTLAYSKEDEVRVLQKAFLGVPLFRKIVDRFQSTKIPVDIFEKLLIKEFDVRDQIASRVTKYFLDGAKTVQLLNKDNTLIASNTVAEEIENNSENPTPPVPAITNKSDKEVFSVTISGPGINSSITILEQGDLDIVETMLKKVRRKLQEVSDRQEESAANKNAA